jgi:hypothetical protein
LRVTTVESTSLATVSYEEAQKLLQLEFCNRVVYLTSAFPLQCTQHYSTHRRRAGISIGPFADGSMIV